MSWQALALRLHGLPGAAVLSLFLSAVAVLVVLHLRRRRHRRALLVSSETLWAKLPAGETPAGVTSRGTRRWREILTPSLLVQLLVVGALALAAGEPRLTAPPARGDLILLVDTSASMGALSAGGPGTRLDEARQRAAAILERLEPGRRARLLELGAQARSVTGATGDRRRIEAALASLRPREESQDLRRSLPAVASEALAPKLPAEVVVLSDQPRPVIAAAAAELLPGAQLEIIGVGRPAANVSLRSFTVERSPEEPGRLSAEVVASNHGDRPLEVRVAIHRAGEPAGTKALGTATGRLTAGGSAVLQIALAARGEITLEARLEAPAVGGDNALALDDRALVRVPLSSRRRLLVVGQRNLYLDGALLSFGGEVRLERATLAEAEGRRESWPGYDVVIFDGGSAPAPPPLEGRYLYIAPAGTGTPFRQQGQIANPLPTAVLREHPLLRQLSLGDLNIRRASRLEIENGDEVPVAAGGAPLVIARSRGPLRLVALAFDPRQSDLPLRPAFPLLLANSFDWLAGPLDRGASQRIGAAARQQSVAWRGVADPEELDTRESGSASTDPRTGAPGQARVPRPSIAVVLLLLALFLHLSDWLASGRGRRRRPAEIVLALAALAATAVALVGPSIERRSRQLQLVTLLDRSPSVGGKVDELHQLNEQGRRAGLAVEQRSFEHSDLGRAIDEALAGLPGDRLGRLLLLSDGLDMGGRAAGAADRAADRGVAIHTRALPPRAPPAVTLGSLRTSGEVREGATFDVELDIQSSAASSAAVALSGPGIQRSERASLRPGANVVRLPVRLEQSEAAYTVELTAPAGSPERAVLAVSGQPRPRVLVLQSAGACQPLRRVLGAARMNVEVASKGLPPPERLREIDLVVLCDLPRRALGVRGDSALVEHVQKGGGGLLVIGGHEGWGAGDYEGSPLAGVVPLEHLPPARKEEATAALALVIDRSGSMSGPKIDLAKEAARASAALMNPLDLLTVIAFDSQASTVVRLQPAGNRQRILGDIGGLRSGGGTNILAGLREAVAELQSADARRKHIILLSDGQSPSEGVPELVEEAVSAHITVSAVGVGDGADLPLLQLIASRGGGRFHRTRDPASLPRIFTRETAEVTSSTEDPRGSRVRAADRAEALDGLPLSSAPPLFGHSRAKERAGAEVLLRSERGPPLLARWQQGLGQVMVFAGDFSARWSGEWLEWQHFGKLWSQLARSLMLRGGGQTLPLEATLVGDDVLVRIVAHDPADRPRRSLLGTLTVREVGPDASLESGAVRQRQLELSELSPGSYQARFPRGDAAALLLEARLRHPESPTSPGWQARGQLALWPPLERAAAPGPSGAALLATLAQRSGGLVLGDDLQAVLAPPPPEQSVPRSMPLRPWLAVLALVLFLADIAARRANFRAPSSPAVESSFSGRGAAW